jgi:hypothetical protein
MPAAESAAMKRALLSLAMAAITAPGLHAAELIDIAWTGEHLFERRVSIAPGQFAEACGKLAKGEAIAWRFDADQALAFNIHYHVGKTVEYPARLDAARQGDGTLAVALDRDYCWMWTNKTATPAKLALTLSK